MGFLLPFCTSPSLPKAFEWRGGYAAGVPLYGKKRGKNNEQAVTASQPAPEKFHFAECGQSRINHK